MEKLKHMEPKKLAIITAAAIAVLGIIGVLISGKMLVVGIIMVLVTNTISKKLSEGEISI